jgi:hypothetical protein
MRRYTDDHCIGSAGAQKCTHVAGHPITYQEAP